MRINFLDNKHSVALTLDCIGHIPFSTAVSVHLRGINQLHAEINSQTQRRDFIGMCPFPLAMPADYTDLHRFLSEDSVVAAVPAAFAASHSPNKAHGLGCTRTQ